MADTAPFAADPAHPRLSRAQRLVPTSSAYTCSCRPRELEQWPSARILASWTRLIEVLPGSVSTRARRATRRRFLERLREGTWLESRGRHVALRLQAEAGHEIRRGKTDRPMSPASTT